MNTFEFRKKYRKDSISNNYNGAANVVMNVLSCLFIIAMSIYFISEITYLSLLVFILVFLVFNFVEYGFHRWLSHNKKVKNIFRRHVMEHHGFFDHKDMTSELTVDLHATILPTKTIMEYYVIFLVLFLFPVYYLFGISVAAFSSLAVVVNILLLDVLHYYYHMKSESLLSRYCDRFRYLRSLKKNHQLHHNRKHMFLYNFNITHPWCDILLNTRYRGE